jgi:hypothetical protein
MIARMIVKKIATNRYHSEAEMPPEGGLGENRDDD